MAIIQSGSSADLADVTANKAMKVQVINADGSASSAFTSIDANNTTVTPLAASGSFVGTGTDILNFAQVNIEIFATPSTAKASFFFEFSKDNTNWDVSVPALVRDPTFVIPIPIINVHKFFRVRYLNDGGVAAIAALGLSDVAGTPTIQTVFRLTSYLCVSNTKELTRTMDQTIQGSDACVLTRAGIMGKNPSGNYVNDAQSGVSTPNSSTAVLGSGATFTAATWESVVSYSSIVVCVDSDLPGTVFVDFSIDGTNVVNTISRSFTRVSAGQSYSFVPSAEFVRIRYTNVTGSGTQAFFRMETYFKSFAIGPIYAPLNTPLVETTLGQVVIAVPNDGGRATYSAASASFAAAALATDIFTITGSATKTIRVLAINITATQTTAGAGNVFLIKRSTADTAGTSAAVTAVPHDSANAAASATVLNYTANPTLGTAVGNVRSRKLFIPGTATASDGGSQELLFGNRPGQAIVLRGVAQQLVVNLGGVTFAGNAFTISAEWTEE